MSDANNNTPTVEELTSSVEKLRKALESERSEHKSTRDAARAFRVRITSGLALGDGADDDAISARLADAGGVAADRVAALTAAAQEATQRAEEIEARWASERVESSLRSAFEKSGARPEHVDDFLLLATPLFALAEDGQVRTRKDAKDTIPGVDPPAWVHSELKAKRGFWWPTSVGAQAHAPRSMMPGASLGDDSPFKPGATWNLTKQFEFEAQFGSAAADAARRRYGGGR